MDSTCGRLIVATLVSLRLLASAGSAAEPAGTAGERPRLVVQTGHITAPYSLGFSPDGRRLITADMDNVGILWDVATGKELRRFCPPGGSLLNSFLSFTDNRFSSGGQYIFSQTSELFSAGPSRLWDTTTGREIQSWQADDRPLDVAFSADGRRMVAVGKDQHLRVWELATGRELRAFRCFDEQWFKDQAQQKGGWFSTWKPVVKFSRFGGYLFTEAPSGVGVVWDTPREKIRHRLNGDLGSITCATFSSDDAFLAVGGDRGTIGLWDVANGRFQRSLVGHHGAVKEIRFSSNRRWVTTVGDASDGTLRIWDAATGRQNAWFRTYYPTLAVGYSPVGRHAATGHADGAVRIWEIVGGQQKRKLVGHTGGVKSIGFSADGKWLLTHGHDETARVWHLGTGKEVRRFQFRKGDGLETGLTVTPPDGDDFVVGGDDGIVRVLNNARGERRIGAMAISPDGGTIALGGEDGEVRLLDRRSGRERRTISAGAPVASRITNLAFTPDGTKLLAASPSGTWLFDVEHGTKIRPFGNLPDLPPAPQPIDAPSELPDTEPFADAPRGPCPHLAALAPSGNFVVTGEVDGAVRLWNSMTGELVWRASLGRKWGPASFLVVSPDDRWVLASSDSGGATLIAVDSGKMRRFMGGRKFDVAAISSDGRRCLTGSTSGTEEWDLAGEKLVRRLRNRETATVADVRVLMDDRVAVVGAEGGVQLWNSPRGDGRRELLPKGFTAVSPFAVSPDGRTFALAIADERVDEDLADFQSTVGLWNAADGRRIRTFGPKAHLRWIVSSRFSPDGKLIETVAYGGAARWRADPMRVEVQAHNLGSLVAFKRHSVIASPDGRGRLEIDEDDVMHAYDLETRRERWRLPGFKAGGNAVGLSGDGRFLVVGGPGKAARRLDAETGEEIGRFRGHQGRVIAVAVAHDSQRVVTFGADDTLRVWDIETSQEVRRFTVPDDYVPLPPAEDNGTSTVMAPAPAPVSCFPCPRPANDENAALAAFTPPRTAVDDGESPTLPSSDEPRPRPANGAVAPRTQPPAAQGEADEQPADEEEEIDATAASNDERTVVAISSDGCWVAASRGGRAHVWSVTGDENYALGALLSRASLSVFASHSDSDDIAALDFSHDGRWLAVGYRERRVVLLDTATGMEVRRCEGYMGDLTTLSFSPDDHSLVTGGTDGMARLWDTATGEELCALVAFDDGNWVVFDREGRYDSSRGGDFDGLHWVVGNKPVGLAQFKQRYYEPGLLAKKLGLNVGKLRVLGGASQSRPDGARQRD